MCRCTPNIRTPFCGRDGCRPTPAPDTGRTPETPADDWQRRFLAHLRDTGNVRRSCEAAGKSRSWVYECRDTDPAFAAEWKAAALDAADLLEETLMERAKDGWDEPVWHQGEQVGVVRKYSNTLAVFLMKHANPEKYGDRTELRHSGPDGGPIQIQQQIDLSLLSDEQLDALESIAARAAGVPPESGGDPPGAGAEEVRG